MQKIFCRGGSLRCSRENGDLLAPEEAKGLLVCEMVPEIKRQEFLIGQDRIFVPKEDPRKSSETFLQGFFDRQENPKEILELSQKIFDLRRARGRIRPGGDRRQRAVLAEKQAKG